MKNLIIEPIVQEDWKFGANNGISKPILTRMGGYLPTYESQRFQSFDPWWCVSGSALNVIETIFNYKIAHGLLSKENTQWLYDNWYIDENGKVNFDDWFLARVSNTVPGKGNSLKAVGDAARHYGLTPQLQSPFKMGDYENDLEDYNQAVPAGLYKLGEEFLQRFSINYEVVYEKDFHSALNFGPLQVAVSNWLKQGNYYIPNGGIIHATMLYNDCPWMVFDTYSPYIKQLADNYVFMSYGYTWYVNDNKPLIIKIMDYFFRLANGAIYWVKGGTNKAQAVTAFNAGLVAITHLMRKENAVTLKDEDLKNFELTEEFFPTEQGFMQGIISLFK